MKANWIHADTHHGHSFPSLSSSVSEALSASCMACTIWPGFTTTQSDQCKSEFTGKKMNFLSNTLIDLFLLRVQESTLSTPPLLRVLKKWDEKKWALYVLLDDWFRESLSKCQRKTTSVRWVTIGKQVTKYKGHTMHPKVNEDVVQELASGNLDHSFSWMIK